LKSKTTHNKPIIIAIDGLSSCGKSTLARDLAKALGYTYIDTGAMYRALTWYMLAHRLSPPMLIQSLPDIKLEFKTGQNGTNNILVNGIDITDEIRSKEVNEQVSQVSTLPEVRHFLVEQQRQMGIEKGIVMDGRDIGTVVFPEAEVKLFLTADSKVRAQRRHLENKQKGLPISYEEVLDNLLYRDRIDSTRAISPLKKAKDAIVLDTTHLTSKEQLLKALDIVESYISK